MAHLVVGIYPDADPKALEGALSGQQLDLSKLKVVIANLRETDATSLLEFVDVAAEMEGNSLSDDMTKGVGVWDETGTNVPGIDGRRTNLGSFSSRNEGGSRSYLAGFAIPDDEVDNFDEAVAQGRAVVIYPDAGNDSPTVAAAFKAAGLRNVRAY